MTKIIYCDTIEELVQLLIERELYGRHSNCLIRFDNRCNLKKAMDGLKFQKYKLR